MESGSEVVLQSSCAAGSFLGWNGRGCSRVRPGWRSHLPMVPSSKVTSNRRATSSAQINAAPAYDFMDVGVGIGHNQRTQFGHLRVGQFGLRARGRARHQTIDSGLIVAMHPVTQRLPIHARLSRSIRPRRALQHMAMASIRRVWALSVLFAASPRSCSGVWSVRVILTAGLIRTSPGRRIAAQRSANRTFEVLGIRRESGSAQVGITPGPSFLDSVPQIRDTCFAQLQYPVASGHPHHPTVSVASTMARAD